MARIKSNRNLSGTYGNLMVYRVGDQLYARTRSSLDGQRFQKDPAFARSRKKAQQFGKASQIAKEVYKTIPNEVKQKGLFGRITGYIQQGLQVGKCKERLIKELQAYYGIVSQTAPSNIRKRRAGYKKKAQPLSLSHWKVAPDGLLYICFPLPY